MPGPTPDQFNPSAGWTPESVFEVLFGESDEPPGVRTTLGAFSQTWLQRGTLMVRFPAPTYETKPLCPPVLAFLPLAKSSGASGSGGKSTQNLS